MIKNTFNMAGILKRSVFRAFCVTLFFVTQSLALSHAAEYNNEPHQHDGVVCEVMVIAPDLDVVMPPALIVSTPEAHISERAYSVPSLPTYLRPDGRAPPGRSPPNQ